MYEVQRMLAIIILLEISILLSITIAAFFAGMWWF